MQELTQSNTAQDPMFDLRRSYVRDGVMRAYANRFGLLAFVCAVIALVSIGFAIYIRLQPPTIIRIVNGEAKVISGPSLFHRLKPPVLANAQSSPEPTNEEKERIIRDFLDDYLNYDYRNIGDRWADALNLTTPDLSGPAVDIIKKEHRIEQARGAQIRSTFEVRELEQSKQDSMSYTVFGIRNVYRIDGTREIAEQMVNRYEIRLALLDRSPKVPRGLLIAKYSEIQLNGETQQPTFAVDSGLIDSRGTSGAGGTAQP